MLKLNKILMIIFVLLICSKNINTKINGYSYLKIKIEIPDTLKHKSYILTYFCKDSIADGLFNYNLSNYDNKKFTLDTTIILKKCQSNLLNLEIRLDVNGYLFDGYGYSYRSWDKIDLTSNKVIYYEKILKIKDFEKIPLH